MATDELIPSALSPDLGAILDAELSAGNQVLRTIFDSQRSPLVVILTEPFRCCHEPLPEAIRCREMDSKNLWKSQFIDTDTGQVVEYRFLRWQQTS